MPIDQGQDRDHFFFFPKKKKKKSSGGPRPVLSFFLLDPIGRLNILVQLIDKLKKEKKNYKCGTHSTSCCWHMTHDIQLNSYKNTLISQDIWLWKVLVWIPSINSCGIKSSLFILYTIKFLFYSNLSIYMCETPFWRLEPWLLAPTLHIQLYL